MKTSTRGEIVQVHGGHILRSTGRKDRHSKVYTAKGPRDRRVRLSAHTAIQFYDVQDRLGYDRPSKAVDWLIKKAKSAIDKLAELPPWNPHDDCTQNVPTSTHPDEGPSDTDYRIQLAENPSSISSSYVMTMPVPAAEAQSIESASKSYFPMNSATNSPMNFLNYPHDVMSRASIQNHRDRFKISSLWVQKNNEDLGLSLHTLHDQNSSHMASSNTHEQGLYSIQNSVNFEANYPRIASWVLPQQQLFPQNVVFSQRETLQSNFAQLVHAWEERQMAGVDDRHTRGVHQSSISNCNFSGDFQFLARIHGDEENGVVSINPSSASSNSHH